MNTETKIYIYKKTILIVSIVVFIISLTQPAYYIDRTDYDAWSNSLLLLIFGWIGAMGGGSGLVWLANPFILISWISVFKNLKTSIIFGALASIFSSSFLLFKKVISSEAPTYSIITDYKLGYWLWTISICFFTFGLIIIYFTNKPKKEL